MFPTHWHSFLGLLGENVETNLVLQYNSGQENRKKKNFGQQQSDSEAEANPE